MKRYTALIISLLLIIQLTACQTASGLFHNNSDPESSTELQSAEEDDFKVGFLFPQGTDAPDTVSHVAAIRKMQQQTGLKDSQVLITRNVSAEKYPEEIENMIGKGCDLIIAKNTAGEDAMIEAAKNHPEIEFCQEDGTKAKESGLANVHIFYVRIFEAYYAAGVAAGVKLNSMLNSGAVSSDSCVIGFVATRENPENISCINAFYLGVRQVCSQASVMVRYVGSSGSYEADGESARQLVAAGARLMCQRVFTTAVAAVCAENDIPIVGNEANIIDVAPNEAVTSAIADWSVYYEYAVNCLLEGKDIDADWCAGYAENAVLLSQFNDAHLAEGTLEKVIEVERELRKRTCKVYDTSMFTIDGETLESLIEGNSEYARYKPYVSGGEFKESEKQAVPVMDFLIDGIRVSTDNYLEDEEDTSDSDNTPEEGQTTEQEQ